MKTSITLITLAALLCGATASLQAYPRGSAIMSPVTNVQLNGMPTVEVGTPQDVAQSRLGKSVQQLTDNTWIFSGFKPSNEHLADHGVNQLMVTFENRRVARMAVVNPKAIMILVSSPGADPRPTDNKAYAANTRR